MTGYHIRLGYNANSDNADNWPILEKAAFDLCEHPIRLYNEAVDFGCPQQLDGAYLSNYAEAYKQHEDATITIDEGTDIDNPPQIMILASGGAPGRTFKEHLGRAFCRLLLIEMHRRGIEISITVA